jgi:hypothetical protein
MGNAAQSYGVDRGRGLHGRCRLNAATDMRLSKQSAGCSSSRLDTHCAVSFEVIPDDSERTVSGRHWMVEVGHTWLPQPHLRTTVRTLHCLKKHNEGVNERSSILPADATSPSGG